MPYFRPGPKVASLLQTSRFSRARLESAQETQSKVARTSVPFALILSKKPLKPKFCYMILRLEKNQTNPVGSQIHTALPKNWSFFELFSTVKILKSKRKFTSTFQFSTIELFKQI